MLDFRTTVDAGTGERLVELPLSGPELLDCPIFNKGSAFSEEERREFGLEGLLPPHVSTIEEQLARAYEEYLTQTDDLGRYLFLAGLQDRNETLFYRLLREHIAEMMPMIYTPVVGEACRQYSHLPRRSRGLFVPYPHRHEIDAILGSAPCAGVRWIVATDGERILGLGDQGAGGMGIPIGKLSLATLCAGVHPATALPVLIDAGTDNRELLSDPLYRGWRHERMRGEAYDDFIERFVESVMRIFPDALLQWEDFSKTNAPALLHRYRDRLRTFNDDIQGTGAVTLAGLLAAMKVTGGTLGRQTIVMLGAGSAATGIADQIVTAAESAGTPGEEARSRIWLVDSQGLLLSDRAGLEPRRLCYAQPRERIAEWKLACGERVSLGDVVRHTRPTILIGVGAQSGAFTEEIVRSMARGAKRPIIFPLSNPTALSEASPADLVAWTDGRALVATGSPFPEVAHRGRSIRIGQCNNAFIFPGVGLGALAVRAARITDGMFTAAAHALAECSPAMRNSDGPLYPEIQTARSVSRRVAIAVAEEAMRLGLAGVRPTEGFDRLIDGEIWEPVYPRLKLIKK